MLTWVQVLATLYGSRLTFGAGAISNGLQFQLASGIRLPSRFRVQREFGLALALDWRGNTNYRRSGDHRPSEARLDTWHLLPAGVYDFPGWVLASGRRVQQFLGAGIGITGYRLSDYVLRFPEPDDPEASLRRGPGGEIPFSALPGGSGQNPTRMLTAGVAIPIGRSIQRDLSYRYTDAGEIGTDFGDITIVRYREDVTRREIPVLVNETTAEYRTHSFLVAIRIEMCSPGSNVSVAVRPGRRQQVCRHLLSMKRRHSCHRRPSFGTLGEDDNMTVGWAS